MTNNKQQTAVEWFANQLHRVVSNTTDALTHNHKELLEQAKEMEITGKEMSYADGYAEGYKRALEYMYQVIYTQIKIK
jgi:flagellar biosynthesis/type III secretory pathway protein FliH